MIAKLHRDHDTYYYLVVDDKIIADTKGHPLKSITNKLCLDNCQAVERDFDLVDHAIAYAGHGGRYLDPHGFSDKQAGLLHGYIDGFNKALELMGNKKFSEEDMFRMMLATSEWLNSEIEYGSDELFKKVIQSLQQTEWDVEVETIEYGLGNDKNGRPVSENRFLLDAGGCLILKRI